MAALHFWPGNVDMSIFSERLKALREARGLTQTRLAELLTADPRVYNRWERGTATPQLDTVVKIAHILQVSLDELAGVKEPVSEPLVHNPKLRALLKDVDSLPDEDQQALIILMDSLLKRSKINRVMAAQLALVYHFEWDHTKAHTNAAKHGITFRLATTVFRDPLALTIFDEEHSENEERWVTLGRAENEQYLVVIHTVQHTGPSDVLIRIISARAADRDEVRDYEETPR